MVAKAVSQGWQLRHIYTPSFRKAGAKVLLFFELRNKSANFLKNICVFE